MIDVMSKVRYRVKDKNVWSLAESPPNLIVFINEYLKMQLTKNSENLTCYRYLVREHRYQLNFCCIALLM